MSNDTPAKLADLLSLGLSHPSVREAGLWKAKVWPITRPFLEDLRGVLGSTPEASGIRWRLAQRNASAKATCIDGLTGEFIERPTPPKTPWFQVSVLLGVDDYDKRYDKKLLWGLMIWGKELMAGAVGGTIAKEYSGGTDEVEAIGSEVFSGGACIFWGRSCGEEELRSTASVPLRERVVSDVIRLLSDLSKHRLALAEAVKRYYRGPAA